MICYKDKAWCSRECENLECSINKKNIKIPEALAWMPIAFRDMQNCDEWKGENHDTHYQDTETIR